MSVQSIENTDAAIQQSDTVYVNLRTASCDGVSERAEDECPFRARYFMVNERGGAAAMCGHHVPDYWLDDDFEPWVFDAHAVECEKDVRREAPSVYGSTGLVEKTHPSHLVEYEECGATAAVVLIDISDRDNDPYMACGIHARPSWLSALDMDPRPSQGAELHE